MNDEDRAAKAKGLPAAFLGGRQKALDKYAPENQGGEFGSFLQEKQKGNGALLAFYTGEPDQATRDKMYADADAQWKSAGNLIRGEVTHLLKKTPGSYLGGASEPGEADCECPARPKAELVREEGRRRCSGPREGRGET